MIFDTDDNPLNSGQISVNAGSAATLTIRVECRAGYKLRAESVPDLNVEARKRGSLGAWTDLESSEIDLSADDGTRVDFDVRLTAGSLSAYALRQFKLKVEI
jgi:hypothetical protein